MSIKRKLKYLEETKQEIRKALIAQEQDVPANTPFREYAQKIRDIEHTEEYDGPYSVKPDIGPIKLYTKNKAMRDDVTVERMALTPKSIYANGHYVPLTMDDADGYLYVDVDVPNTYTDDDEGKVVDDRELVEQTSTTKTANGTYDTTLNNEVVVDVPNTYNWYDEGKVVSSGALVSQTSLSITSNGTHDTTLHNQVEVSVSPPVLLSKTITENGTYNAADENAEGYSEVAVNVQDPGIFVAIGGESGPFINDTITKVRDYAFYFCTTLTEASFPNCLSIGSSAFYDCTALSNISFPKCESIGESAFYSCSSLANAILPSCKTIGNNAFYNNIELSNISFPECETVGYNAFRSCSSLTELNFPKCKTINGSAFYWCVNVSQISFPECTTISGSYAFGSCSSLAEAVFPKLGIVPSNTFTNCSNLSRAIFPECTSINTGFQSCRNLTYISFPECSVVGYYAFAVCSALSEVYFPKCETIGISAFMSCSSLGRASFPMCKFISTSTFRDCRSLSQLYLLGSYLVSLANTNAFASTPMSNSTYLGYYGSIYVPASLYSNYIAGPNWSQYSARFVSLTDEEIAAL